MLKTFSENIIIGKVFLGDKLIAMGVYFRNEKYFIHIFLELFQNVWNTHQHFILKYALTIFGHEKEYLVIHYGGGSFCSLDNNLYKFKRKFGKNKEFDFYIAKKCGIKLFIRDYAKKKM